MNALYPWQEELFLLGFLIIYGSITTVAFGMAIISLKARIKRWLKQEN